MYGVSVGAGNTTFIGGNITENLLGGVDLITGTNHTHGLFMGTQIDHNAAYNIQAVNVTNGHKFPSKVPPVASVIVTVAKAKLLFAAVSPIGK